MRKTVMDYANTVWINYIARSPKPTGTKEKSKKFVASEWAPENAKQGYDKLTPLKRRLIAEESPLLMKGIKKKCADTFRAWFILETMKGRGNPIKADMDTLQKFELRSNYKVKLTLARKAAHIYGDGFLMITFKNDTDIPVHAPPRENAEPVNVEILNSEYITGLKFYSEKYEKEGILHYHYLDTDNKEMYIHPDRIQWIPENLIPGFNLGVSSIDLLRWTLFSKKNIDIAAGNILAWFSHGILDLDIMDLEEDEKKEYMKIAEQHPGTWVHDQNMKMDIKNPTSIDPKPFYDYVVLNIAAAINMPTHVLTGVQMGRVTGAEIGFADYYRDVSDDQELLFTPLITNLYSRILKAKGRKWKYNIVWNPIYIDEMAEAKLLDIKITAAANAKAAGLIDTEEGRLIINKGQIELDIEKKIKEPKPIPTSPQKPVNPNKPPTRELKGKEAEKADAHRLGASYKIIGGLGQEEKEMIVRCKTARKKMINAMAEREKTLGKSIIEEQR